MITINCDVRSNAEMLVILQEKSPAFVSFAWTSATACSCEVDLALDITKTQDDLAAILAVVCSISDKLKTVIV